MQDSLVGVRRGTELVWEPNIERTKKKNHRQESIDFNQDFLNARKKKKPSLSHQNENPKPDSQVREIRSCYELLYTLLWRYYFQILLGD